MSARASLSGIASQDMPVSGEEITDAIRAADLELAALVKAHGEKCRAMRGEGWFDGVLEVAELIAALPRVEAP